VDLVNAELPSRTLVVGIDPGKATNRILLATGEKGLIGEPLSLPTQRLFGRASSKSATRLQTSGAEPIRIPLVMIDDTPAPLGDENEEVSWPDAVRPRAVNAKAVTGDTHLVGLVADAGVDKWLTDADGNVAGEHEA
jgi:hypothetical protein